MSKRQSPTTVVFRTTLTRAITVYEFVIFLFLLSFLLVFSTYCLLHYLKSLLKLAPIVVQRLSCHFPAMLREWNEGLLQLQVVKWPAENGSK